MATANTERVGGDECPRDVDTPTRHDDGGVDVGHSDGDGDNTLVGDVSAGGDNGDVTPTTPIVDAASMECMTLNELTQLIITLSVEHGHNGVLITSLSAHMSMQTARRRHCACRRRKW